MAIDTPQIFVSHSHSDNAYCRAFVAALQGSLGSAEAVWYDEHNLGWGALRQTIDQELRQRQHFIVILSPTAIASDWVNTEIDAALALLRTGNMRTIQFVTAASYEVPPTLQRYKRVERPGGTSYPPAEAAARALAVITGPPGRNVYPPQTLGVPVPVPASADLPVTKSRGGQLATRGTRPRPTLQSLLTIGSAVLGLAVYYLLPWITLDFVPLQGVAGGPFTYTGAQLVVGPGNQEWFLFGVIAVGVPHLLGVRFRSLRLQLLLRLAALLCSIEVGVTLVFDVLPLDALVSSLAPYAQSWELDFGFYVFALTLVGIAVGSVLPRGTSRS